MITIFINNILQQVASHLTVLQACEQASVEVPRFCYHEKLSVAGNCRMCLVEIEKSPKPVAACALPIMSNMSIFTNSPLVRKAREAILEFLLINHPLDCPICDQGGDCDLQDQTLIYGSDKSRFYEWKRSVEDKSIGPNIKTIMTRCIHCTRCVRFAQEIGGFAELGAFGRGNKMEIGTYIHKFLKSELSGNMIDLCPVGALTTHSGPFTSRTWELQTTQSIDFTDACGSNIIIYSRSKSSTEIASYNKLKSVQFSNIYFPKDDIIRILPNQNDLINENWISNKTRFIYDGIIKNRINKPFIVTNNKQIPCFWEDVYSNLFTILQNNSQRKYYLNKYTNIFKYTTYKKLIGIFSSISDCESIYSLFQFLHLYGSNNIQYSNELLFINIDIPLFYNFNTEIKNIELSDSILLIGCNPRFEATIINARIKKHTNKNPVKIFSIGNYAELTYRYKHLGNSTKTLIDITEGKHLVCQELRLSKFPLIIIGTSILKRRDSEAILNLTKFLGYNLFVNSVKFNGYNILHCNIGQVHAFTLGAIPGVTSDLYINDKKKKRADLLYSLEMNHLNKKKWLKKKTKIISHSSHHINNLVTSGFVLPCLSPYEKTNIVVNTEGRVQQANKAITPPSNVQSITKPLQDIMTIFKFKNQSSFNKKIFYFENPQLFKQNQILNKFNFNILKYRDSKNKIYLSSFLPLIINYYMTDIIGQNSKLMSEHSLVLKLTLNLIKLEDIIT